MNAVTILWSGAAGACLMLALMHSFVWIKDRQAWPSLAFAVMACGVVGHALMELSMMTTQSPDRYGASLLWSHLFSFTVIASSVVFVRLYLGAGRTWLAATVIGLRFITLVLNFFFCEVNINYTSIRSLHFVPFLGEEVAIVGDADLNPLMWMAQTTFPLWLAFTVDATRSCWKRTDHQRRRCYVGGSMVLFILLATTHAALALNGLIAAPIASSIAFGFMTLVMGYELSRDVLHAARLARDLKTSEQRLSLAATAARVVLWEWRAGQDQVWASTNARPALGLPPGQPLSFSHFTNSLHPGDRDRVLKTIQSTVETLGSFSTDYRRVNADGSIQWFAGSGSAESDPATGVTLLRGVSVDVTESRETRESLAAHREQLSHTLRLATMTQMAASLAHELNQPLTAIVNNANAARRMLSKNTASHTDLLEIFEDISADGLRAGAVIRGIRAMAQPHEQARVAIALHQVIDDLMPLIAAEAKARNVHVVKELADTLPPALANPVQIQQVLLNLVINAMEALDTPGATKRIIVIRTETDGTNALVASVRDFGPGLPPNTVDRVFEPFFTTKSNGLGMGLAIVRSLIESHGGSITAANAIGGGAQFQIRLPASPPAS